MDTFTNPTATRIARLFKEGRLNEAAVQNAVTKGLLTPTEAEAILHPAEGENNAPTEA